MDVNLDCFQKIYSHFDPPQLKSWLCPYPKINELILGELCPINSA